MINFKDLPDTKSGLLGAESLAKLGEALEAMGQPARAELAHTLVEQIEKTSGMYNKAVYGLGEVLLAIKKFKLYRDLGYDTFKAFLAASSLNISERMAQILMKAAEFMAKLDKRPELATVSYEKADVSKLVLVIKPVDDALARQAYAEAQEWLQKALPVSMGGLSRSDLAKALVEAGYSAKTLDQYLVLSQTDCAYVTEVDDEEALVGDVVVKVGKWVRGREKIAIREL